jgi:hypothetical protein
MSMMYIFSGAEVEAASSSEGAVPRSSPTGLSAKKVPSSSQRCCQRSSISSAIAAVYRCGASLMGESSSEGIGAAGAASRLVT